MAPSKFPPVSAAQPSWTTSPPALFNGADGNSWVFTVRLEPPPALTDPRAAQAKKLRRDARLARKAVANPAMPPAPSAPAPEEGIKSTPTIWTNAKDAVKRLWRPVGRAYDFVNDKAAKGRAFFHARPWIGWSLPLVSIALSLGRAAYDESGIEKERLALAVPADAALESLLLSAAHVPVDGGAADGALSWAEDIAILQKYPHDPEVVKTTVPKLFENAVTPEAALILYHGVLETFSKSPSVSESDRVAFKEIADAEFDKANARFGEKLAVPYKMSGLVDLREKSMRVDEDGDGRADRYFHGIELDSNQQRIVDGIEARLETEKRALLEFNDAHVAWLKTASPGAATEELAAIEARGPYLENYFSTDWRDLSERLERENNGLYSREIATSRQFMGDAYLERNRGYWDLYREDLWAGQSRLVGLAGFFAAPYFVSVNAITFLPVGFYYGAGTTAITAPSGVHDAYLTRKLVPLNLPDYGTKGEAV